MCEFWPKSALPADFGEDVAVGVPTLVISGTIDPVTSPYWGEDAVRHLPRARHIVVPAAHGVDDPCVDAIRLAFFDDPDVEALDVSCVDAMRLPPFDTGG